MPTLVPCTRGNASRRAERTLRTLSLATMCAVLLHPSQATAQATLPTYLRDVVSHHAPIILAENYKSPYIAPEVWDHLLAVDFDQDLNARNNYADVVSGYVPDRRATVYFSVIETGQYADRGYFFINYYFYHPTDAGISVLGLNGSGAHEHDLEGVMLVVKKVWWSPYGQPVAGISQAHGALIPWKGYSSPVPLGNPAGGPWMGTMMTWNDLTFAVRRPVIAIRSRKHGTYFATDCSHPVLLRGDSYYGAMPDAPGATSFGACWHDDSDLMAYFPVPLNVAPSSGIAAASVDRNARTGSYYYRLVHLAESPIWSQRTDNFMFWGNSIFIAGGYVGYDKFSPSDPFATDHSANPPWQWRGGTGECVSGMCWYTFGSDNTTMTYNPISYPAAPNTGAFVADPVTDAGLWFPFLPELNEPVRYDPYLSNPPTCCASYLLNAHISGPTAVNSGETNTWSAIVTGGTPPYRYQWSGALWGTGSAVSGSLTADDVLYLDVYDANGAHLAVSTAIAVAVPPDPDPPCGGPIAC